MEILSMEKKIEKSYTIMVLPNPTAKAHRFIITKKALKIVLGLGSIFLVLLVVFLIQYVQALGERWELASLRKEAKGQRLQIQAFTVAVNDLKKEMGRLKELDTKLRVITDIGPPAEKSQLLGMGGPEEINLDNPTSLESRRPDEVLHKMEQDVSRLQAEAVAQELSFQELTEGMKDRRSLWAATPSIWPVKGWLTSGFGNRISPFTGDIAMHNGIDIASHRDTPIVAAAAGVVSYEGFDSGLGKVVKINHGYGMQTMYGHLSKTAVKIGQRVKRGDVIAYVGNTGLSTGPHLHYEVIEHDVPVNPMRYILN
jgi:murein DD-endopeptidase MepM/ murein hydrolase activator NlpD